MTLNKRKVNYFFVSETAKERLEEYLRTGDCYPLDVVVHLNTICNHRCNFCYNFLSLSKTGKRDVSHSLDTDYTINLLQELEDVRIESLVVSGGGEPLLHPGIETILTKANDSDFSTFLYTNLDHNLNQNLISSLAKLDAVNVNINTINEDCYRLSRGRYANLNRVKRNIETLLERGATVDASVILRDDSIPTAEETINWIADRGIRSVNVSPAFELQYRDGVSTSEKFFQKLIELRKIITRSNVRILEPVEKVVTDSKGSVICKTHYFDITIGADYLVYPCCMVSYFDGYDIVNLKNYNSFDEAWKSKERQSWIDNVELECSTCWFAPANLIIKQMRDVK